MKVDLSMDELYTIIVALNTGTETMMHSQMFALRNRAHFYNHIATKLDNVFQQELDHLDNNNDPAAARLNRGERRLAPETDSDDLIATEAGNPNPAKGHRPQSGSLSGTLKPVKTQHIQVLRKEPAMMPLSDMVRKSKINYHTATGAAKRGTLKVQLKDRKRYVNVDDFNEWNKNRRGATK